MCFSASSSFTASFLLTAIGIITLRTAKQKNLIPYASIPLLFALQQACEGVVWLTIDNPTTFIHHLATYLFIVFAAIIWPVWMPLSLLLLETGKRKKILMALEVLGIGVATFIVYKLITEVLIAQHIKSSLYYYIANIELFEPRLQILLYTIPVVGPFFITKMPYAKVGGIMGIGSLMVAYVIKYETFGSVWCFFAALLSVFVLFSVQKYNTQRIK